MPIKCVACGQFTKGGVICPECKSCSHYACVRVPAGTVVPASWRCGDCQMRTPKGRDPSTPVRVSQVYLDVPARARSAESLRSERPPPAGEEPMLLDDTAHNITAEFGEMELQLTMTSLRNDLLAEFRRMEERVQAELGSIKLEVQSLSAEIKEVRHEVGELRTSYAGVATRMDGLEERLAAVEKQQAAIAAVPASDSAAVIDLQTAVALLQQELNDKDQEALLADLEIGHLPEERGESVLHSVVVLAAKLGVPLEERDIVFAERVGVAQMAGAGLEKPHARRVVVRLARRELRDRMLQGARVRRTLTAADAGRAGASVPGPADIVVTAPRIYVNERLTRQNRQLFHRVREECRRLNWRYVWTRRGRIYARQGDGKFAHPIRSQQDIARVFV